MVKKSGYFNHSRKNKLVRKHRHMREMASQSVKIVAWPQELSLATTFLISKKNSAGRISALVINSYGPFHMVYIFIFLLFLITFMLYYMILGALLLLIISNIYSKDQVKTSPVNWTLDKNSCGKNPKAWKKNPSVLYNSGNIQYIGLTYFLGVIFNAYTFPSLG